ncbi:heme o synthase [Litorimonas sp. RW-G-Af-16]|uniref:heme o synthase n=1 Tax=Litorimonas sp. RW-G-Af-16 TaxID=3241168 RepID=UPI00390C818B
MDAAFNTSGLAPASGLSLAEPRDYFALMKPRVMSLVVFTAWAGLVLAPGSLPLWSAIASIICIAAGAGASGALNMWYDADIDAQMSRTKKRPIPQGKMAPRAALGFGLAVSIASVWMLYIASNLVAAGLLAFTIFFYLVIYTMWLKRSTPQNIVIGGAAGAFPPMIGYAAVTGSITLDSVLLFMITFMWTPPHFWALALYKAGDYGKVGIPMMPNVAGPKSTRLQIMIYSVILTAVTLAPIATGMGGTLYAVAAVLLNLGFLALAFKVWKSRAGEKKDAADEASLYAVTQGDRAARNLFFYSILYLFALFGVLAAEGLLKGFGA